MVGGATYIFQACFGSAASINDVINQYIMTSHDHLVDVLHRVSLLLTPRLV